MVPDKTKEIEIMSNKIETLKSEIADLVEQLNNKKQERTLNLASLEVKKEEIDNYEIDPDLVEESYKEALNEGYEMPNGWDYADVLIKKSSKTIKNCKRNLKSLTTLMIS